MGAVATRREGTSQGTGNRLPKNIQVAEGHLPTNRRSAIHFNLDDNIRKVFDSILTPGGNLHGISTDFDVAKLSDELNQSNRIRVTIDDAVQFAKEYKGLDKFISKPKLSQLMQTLSEMGMAVDNEEELAKAMDEFADAYKSILELDQQHNAAVQKLSGKYAGITKSRPTRALMQMH